MRKKSLHCKKKENAELKEQLNRMQDPQFVEEEARDKLFLVKPGESNVIIPQNLLTPTSTSVKKTTSIPIWQQWLVLFE